MVTGTPNRIGYILSVDNARVYVLFIKFANSLSLAQKSLLSVEKQFFHPFFHACRIITVQL